MGPGGAGSGFVESFSGSFDADTRRFWLEPRWLVPSGLLPREDLPAVAGHVLEFVDGAGEAVGSVPLRGPVYEDSDRELEWEVYVAERPAFSRVRIRSGQQTIVEYSGTSSAPEVDAARAKQTDPSAGFDGFSPYTVGVSWRARDADGGALWARVYYSSDGGDSYRLAGETHRDPASESPSTPGGDYIEHTPNRELDDYGPRWDLRAPERAQYLLVVSDGICWSAARSQTVDEGATISVLFEAFSLGGDVSDGQRPDGAAQGADIPDPSRRCVASDSPASGMPQGHAGLGLAAGSGLSESFVGSFDTETGRSWLRPVWPVPSSTVSEPEAGLIPGHVLEFVDGAGEAVGSVPLRGPVYEDSDRELEWEVYVAERPAFSRVRIRSGQQTIVEYSGTSSAPEVDAARAEQTDPSAGFDGFSPYTVGVSWRARDTDGGALWARVYYSSDGGDSYRLAGETHRDPASESPFSRAGAHVDDTSVFAEYRYRWLGWELQASERAQFLVVVSDGVCWSAAASPRMSVAAPEQFLEVLSPRNGEIYSPDGEIILNAHAQGVHRGAWTRELPASVFRWSSDIDGEIAADAYTTPEGWKYHGLVPAGSLSPGTHRITATATDEKGNTASATVTIEIRGQP